MLLTYVLIEVPNIMYRIEQTFKRCWNAKHELENLMQEEPCPASLITKEWNTWHKYNYKLRTPEIVHHIPSSPSLNLDVDQVYCLYYLTTLRTYRNSHELMWTHMKSLGQVLRYPEEFTWILTTVAECSYHIPQCHVNLLWTWNSHFHTSWLWSTSPIAKFVSYKLCDSHCNSDMQSMTQYEVCCMDVKVLVKIL